ncbi:MAG TPA: hypothetical protein VFS43_47330 [Polyangiaceae bacterium]|nr:hypothetical protein [Polyangiaceae bacterium]
MYHCTFSLVLCSGLASFARTLAAMSLLTYAASRMGSSSPPSKRNDSSNPMQRTVGPDSWV